MNNSGKRFAVFMSCVLAAAVAVFGCGGGGGSDNAEVAGSVAYDGKPLTQGSVRFLTMDGKPAEGKIGPEGRFAVSAAQGKGVPPGPCQVAVIVTQQQNQKPGVDRFQAPKWLIPNKFGSTDTSGLHAEIKPDRNELKIELFSNGRGSITRVE